MNELLLGLSIIGVVLVISWGLLQRSRQIQYPFLIATVYIGWVTPQLVGLSLAPPYDLPPGALSKTIVMATLCLAALFFGYTLNKKPARLFWWKFNDDRLILCAAGLSLFGAYFFFQVAAMAELATAEYRGQWSGAITIYVFLSNSLTVGMVIALVMHLLRPRWTTLAIVGFDLIFFLIRIVIQGRRAAMVELGMITLMALWFRRHWLPPRWFIIISIVGGALLINSIGEYRNAMTAEDRFNWSGASLQSIFEIDFVGNLRSIATGEKGTEELRNAVMNIEAADELGVYDYGLSLWNQFIFAFVPGQWFGPDVKQGLTIDFGNDAKAYFNFVPYPGTTLTGFSDAFLSFWYFGAIKFFLAGLIVSRWYLAAINGNIVAQMVMMLIITDAMQLVTHSTGTFFLGFIDIGIFLLPALLLSRVRFSNKSPIDRSKANAPLFPTSGRGVGR